MNIKGLIKYYEKWLKNAEEKFEENENKLLDYKQLDMHSCFLANERGYSKAEVDVLKMIISDLKKLIEED